ncbi:F-box/LRR-repeat protein At3g59200-like [Abrus precatorius]|uniref:F-box/LRR-repeat protein At3g59200-like n=1 Tax=Abrus precatorius TaxID=3816 RepID=A0A8B8L4Y6_ABRPR|nr:F-box/LRR-repeat protein At3g59200-like [Abrus precatorius]
MSNHDRISALSDDVLRHILSFMPTRDAFTTSLLSKRWRPLWLTVPTLNFHERDYLVSRKKHSFSFVKFVHAIILIRGLNPSIKSFTLNCCSSPDLYNSDLYIRTSLEVLRKIEHLDLEIRINRTLPFCFFAIKTLVVLRLNGLTVNNSGSVDFPSLKTMHLNRITFREVGDFLEILYGCPVLEDLRAYNLLFFSYKIPFSEEPRSLPKLVRAEIDMIHDTDIPLKLFSNAESLYIQQFSGDIPLFPHLTQLKFSPRYYAKWNVTFEMLKCCPKLRELGFHKFSYGDVHCGNKWTCKGFGVVIGGAPGKSHVFKKARNHTFLRRQKKRLRLWLAKTSSLKSQIYVISKQ